PSGRTIGTLDEEFVVGKAEPGVTFICRGEAWRVIEVEDDQVSVEPVNDPYGAIPSWEGELIPVPYKIAQEAGETQRKIETELNTAKENLEEIKKELKKKYSLDDNSADWIIRHVQEQKSEASIPTDKKILIETYKKFAVLHSYYGTKVNKTLAQILASLLSARIGASVGVRSDPYRIAFRFSQKAEPEHLKEALENLESKHVDPLIEKVLKDSSLFRWRLLHVAKRFGAIKKDADFSQIKGRQLLRAFEGTPIWKEAEREVRQEKLSIKKLQEITEEIQSGNISITIRDRLEREGPTPMGWSIVNELASYGEIVVPKRAEKAILKALKNRLQNRQVRLFCMNCYDWSVLTRVKRLPAHPECKNCGARLLTLVPWRNKKVRGILKRASKGENLSEEEEKRFERAKKAANLILTYGKPSIIAMAARGVGPATATRILSKPNTGEESFYRSILKAERLYARTHRFWD
ncbi:MAG: hypothetical protein KGY45_05105, partial [Hadesarchaea archaeon]|nr:hypothetical protein [Hadesarchaea archaeon]